MAFKNVGQSAYKKAAKYAEDMSVPRSAHKRTDCPICGGTNSFSVSNERGQVKFNCFRNSCSVAGFADKANYSYDDLKSAVIDKISFTSPPAMDIYTSGTFTNALIGNIRPEWAPVEPFSKCWDMLDKYNCLDVYEVSPEKFKYDPAQDRLVFIEYTNEVTASLATGRSLCGESPKWYKYIADDNLFTAYTHEEGNIIPIEHRRSFICEDAPSACSLARFGVGYALCGTTYDTKLLSTYLDKLPWPVYICLDSDALKKAMALKRDLEVAIRREVRILHLSDDAKYLNYHQLAKELKNG